MLKTVSHILLSIFNRLFHIREKGEFGKILVNGVGFENKFFES
jgi:hypothetical protein